MNRLGPDGWSNVVFDLDGTLVDSSSLHEAAYRGALQVFRPDLLDIFDYNSLKGKTTRDAFQKLGIINADEIDRLAEEKQRRYRAAVAAGELKPLPGARELIAALMTTGRCLFLVTSGSSGSVAVALNAVGMAAFFTGVVCGSDVKHGKPAPDAFKLCLDRFKLVATSSVVIEDAESGITAARGAGLEVVGVHDVALAQYADFYFPDLVVLRDWLAVPLRQPMLAS